MAFLSKYHVVDTKRICKNAFITIEKLESYCLNPYHRLGKNKAMVFNSALGLTQKDSLYLQNAILNTLSNSNATLEREDQYGKRYTVDVKIFNPCGV